MATREAVIDALEFLGRCKPAARFDANVDEQIDAYWRALSPLDDALLDQAALVAARHAGEYLPSAGTLYQIALDLLDQSPVAEAAWSSVLQAAQGRSVPLKPRAQAALDAIGGREALARADAGQTIAHRARFLDAYKRLAGHWRAQANLGRGDGLLQLAPGEGQNEPD